MIVLAYFIYFGVPYCLNNMMGFSFTLTALQAGTVCLALNCGAYMAEIIRAGIQSIDQGQTEAAGDPYYDSKYHQSVYHHSERYFHPVRYRIPGTGQHCKERCCQFFHVLPDMGYCCDHVPDRHHNPVQNRKSLRKEIKPWP